MCSRQLYSPVSQFSVGWFLVQNMCTFLLFTTDGAVNLKSAVSMKVRWVWLFFSTSTHLFDIFIVPWCCLHMRVSSFLFLQEFSVTYHGADLTSDPPHLNPLPATLHIAEWGHIYLVSHIHRKVTTQANFIRSICLLWLAIKKSV